MMGQYYNSGNWRMGNMPSKMESSSWSGAQLQDYSGILGGSMASYQAHGASLTADNKYLGSLMSGK